MLYVEYNDFKIKYYEAQKKYDEILNEKEKLFIITQPKSTDLTKERVDGGTPNNPFEDYLIMKEKKQVDERLEEIRSILEDRQRLLKLKEEELRSSKEWINIIYVYYYIDRLSITKIEKRIPYSRVQIWRILKEIKKNVR